MFENQTADKEVADIFAGVDKTLAPAASVNPAPAVEPSFAPPPTSHGMLMRILIIGGIVLAVAVIGLVLYKFVFATNNSPIEEMPGSEAVVPITEPIEKVAPAEAAPDKAVKPVVELDSDSDGLVDSLEQALGTNILKPDTDGDLLYDYDEVKLYETDPLNTDTDGDGYPDGEEVANGYNPKGAGKLLNFDEAMNGVK